MTNSLFCFCFFNRAIIIGLKKPQKTGHRNSKYSLTFNQTYTPNVLKYLAVMLKVPYCAIFTLRMFPNNIMCLQPVDELPEMRKVHPVSTYQKGAMLETQVRDNSPSQVFVSPSDRQMAVWKLWKGTKSKAGS